MNRIFGGIDHAHERLASRIGEDRGGVEAFVLRGCCELVPRESQTNLIQEARRERMSLAKNQRVADGKIGLPAAERCFSGCEDGAPKSDPAAREMILFVKGMVDADQ